ncbi:MULTISPECIES: nitroreductase family protein [Methanobacterium]|uniref:Nitroreductase n=1 Tax=Methanobacterium formicicum TaxID=2162 RepID=A0A090JVJ2_METFO|nr:MULTISPECIES: nitroreductase family protein [Methanobacterium]KUK74927.1 MAG: Nitroreductase [Methanobacterium sp. 42_16]MDH2660202.1 nitroreductase family protein [Methanobacterium formicicum]CEA13501.1 nitroreductase [Methanobacterium formicicum]
MDVFEAVTQRKSIRKYKDKEIEKEKLIKVLESARIAPSASNRQEWKFIVVKDEDTRSRLVSAAHYQKFVGQAPVTIVACSTESERIMPCGQHAYTVDLSIAVSFMMLEATELGLGTCWLGAFDEEAVKEILGIPSDIRVPAMFTLGYADENPVARPRKALKDIVSHEKYE